MDDAFCRQIREVAKRVRESSNLDGSDSPMKHEDNVSGTKEMIPRSKKPRTLPVNGFSRINWSRHEEILILTSIIDYEKEFGLSFSSDYDDLCRYVQKYIKASFTKKQLMDKIEYLKEKFLKFQARSNTNDGEIARCYTDNDDLFHLSMIIWGRNKTQSAAVENSNQPKDVPFVEQENRDGEENRDVPTEESRDVPISEEAGLNSNQPMDVPFVEQENRDVHIEENRDVPCVEQENRDDVPSQELERVEIDNAMAEKDNSEEAGLDDQLHILTEVVEAQPNFKNLGKFQQKRLLADIGKLDIEKKMELINEWKALMVMELQLDARKKMFSAKLAKGGV